MFTRFFTHFCFPPPQKSLIEAKTLLSRSKRFLFSKGKRKRTTFFWKFRRLFVPLLSKIFKSQNWKFQFCKQPLEKVNQKNTNRMWKLLVFRLLLRLVAYLSDVPIQHVLHFRLFLKETGNSDWKK